MDYSKKIKITVRELRELISEIVNEEINLKEQASSIPTSLGSVSAVKPNPAVSQQVEKDIERTVRNAQKIAMSPTIQKINKQTTSASTELSSALNEPDPLKRVQRINKAAQELQNASAQATGVAHSTGVTGATGITGTSTKTATASTVTR
jgi:hypothetical protein